MTYDGVPIPHPHISIAAIALPWSIVSPFALPFAWDIICAGEEQTVCVIRYYERRTGVRVCVGTLCANGNECRHSSQMVALAKRPVRVHLRATTYVVV